MAWTEPVADKLVWVVDDPKSLAVIEKVCGLRGSPKVQLKRVLLELACVLIGEAKKIIIITPRLNSSLVKLSFGILMTVGL